MRIEDFPIIVALIITGFLMMVSLIVYDLLDESELSGGVINHDLRLKDRYVLAANNIKAFAFDRQILIENLGNSRVGRTQINAQGKDKVAALCGSSLQRTEKPRGLPRGTSQYFG